MSDLAWCLSMFVVVRGRSDRLVASAFWISRRE